MKIRDLKNAGHWPTLLAAFLYFDVSFAVWYVLGPLATFIADDLGLTIAEKGVLVATPLLGGSICRIAMGTLTDHVGPRRAGLVGIALTFVPLLLGWLVVDSYRSLLVMALLLGVPGASFAVALPLASRWYPPQHQGLVMGIAGAGNSGTVLASLFMPRLAAAFGWHAAIGLAAIPMALAALVFLACAKDSPTQPPPRPLREYLGVARQMDTVWFAIFYSITFGGFVGLASTLAIFFHDQYGVSKVAAGDLTAICVFAGSFMRPLGGWLADRHGGIRMLQVLYGLVAVLLAAIATLPSLAIAVPLFVAALAVLGAGNGAVFQLVPLRFQREVGVITGLVGAAGGLGGFFLPSVLGVLRDATGTWTSGFAFYAAICLWGMSLVVAVKGAWELTWAPHGEPKTGWEPGAGLTQLGR
jgi:NNP family nitrate/nitrite transporter-like MFS transporter